MPPGSPAAIPAAVPTGAAFLAGLRDGLPFLLVIGPFGLLFGVAATEAGLDLFAALTFSVAVIAGASQFTALQLMVDRAPVLIVLVTSLAVNLRMAMYSAALTPHLGRAPLWQRALIAYFLVDATYACAAARYEREPGWDLSRKVAYFFGTVLPVCPIWYVTTVAGALVGRAIPEWMALDFAVPICFLAMVAPMLRTIPHVVAAGVSIALSLALAFIPWSMGLLVAAVLAMMAGAEAERRLGRRAAA